MIPQRHFDELPELRTVIFGHADHAGDHFAGENRREVLLDIEPARVGFAQTLLHLLDDSVPLRCHCPGRERFVDQATQPTVLGRIHIQDRRWRWLPTLHHRKIESSCRRVRLMVPEGRGHVLVAGERAEVQLLVVLDRLLRTHPSKDCVRTGEEFLGVGTKYKHHGDVEPGPVKHRPKLIAGLDFRDHQKALHLGPGHIA